MKKNLPENLEVSNICCLSGQIEKQKILMHMNKIFKYLCVGLVMMKSLAWCTANEVERDAFNIQVESVTDTILEETDLSFDSVMQNDGDVINEVSVQPLNDNVDKSGISVPQNVLQPKSDKLTQSNQKDKKTKNKQERQQKKPGEKQKKLIEKTKKKDVIQQRKEERIKKKYMSKISNDINTSRSHRLLYHWMQVTQKK